MKCLLKTINLFALILIILCINIASADTIAWPTYQGNYQRTGYVNITPDPATFKMRWAKGLFSNKSCHYLFKDYPTYGVTSGSMLYLTYLCVTFDDQKLESIYTWYMLAMEADSHIVWSKEFDNVANVSAPTFNDGKIYLGVINEANINYHRSYGELNVYDASTGAQLHTQAISPEFKYSPVWYKFTEPVILDNKIYYKTDSDDEINFFSFDKSTFQPIWQHKVSFNQAEQTFNVPSINQNSLAYYHMGTLDISDPLTGKLQYSIVDPTAYVMGVDHYRQSPVLDQINQLAITISEAGGLTIYDLKNGLVKWDRYDSNFKEVFYGQPAIHNNVIYAVLAKENDNGNSPCLMALSENTGNELWKWCPENQGSSDNLLPYFIVTNSLIFISDETKTYAVDLKTHKTVWTYPESGNLSIDQKDLYIIPIHRDQPITAISLS